MATAGTTAAAFAGRLQREMAQRSLSNRALGKLIDPERPERGRRQVLRHLSGKHSPSRQSRTRYAVVLGLPEDEFVDDDEEEDNVSLNDALLEITRAHREVSRKIAGLARFADEAVHA